VSGERTYHVLGVPLRTGSLYPGNENDARAYREARLPERLQAAGCRIVDAGDVAIPSYLPHHAVPPIRSWPGPRVAWDCVGERVFPLLQQPGHVPLLVGCDCSLVVGTTDAVRRAAGGDVHVLYVDGDFDDAAPIADRCQSAAAVAVWLLTNAAPFWTGPPLRPDQVTVVGWSNPSASNQSIRSVSLADVRRLGAAAAARQALAGVPATAAVLVHLDIDVFAERHVPAAYFPHPDGLSFAEGAELLGPLLRDPRVRLIELAEYAWLRDQDLRVATGLVDLLVETLKAT
jgi:arginase family enzyme